MGMIPFKPLCQCGHRFSQHLAPGRSHGAFCAAARSCFCESYTPAITAPASKTGEDSIAADLHCAMCGSSIHIEGAAAVTQSPLNVWIQVHAHTPKDPYR